MNFLNIMSEHWAINAEQVSNININIDQNTIFLYINGAEEPSIRIECENDQPETNQDLYIIAINPHGKRQKEYITNSTKMKLLRFCKS